MLIQGPPYLWPHDIFLVMATFQPYLSARSFTIPIGHLLRLSLANFLSAS